MRGVVFFAAFIAVEQGASAQPRPTAKEWNDAKERVASEAAAVAAKQAKMTAVNKVVSLLEGLKAKVMSEGEEEAHTYNKFSCFCKDVTTSKTDAIKSGEDETARLTSEIQEGESTRAKLDTQIATVTEDIAIAEKSMKSAAASRADSKRLYEKNEADLIAAIDALEGAINSLKTSRSPALLQERSLTDTLRTAALLADSLGLSASNALEAFLQQAPEVNMQHYDFHSDGIITTLEKLLADFRNEKSSVDAQEVESVKLHESFMQEQTDLVKEKTAELESAKKKKAQRQAEISEKSLQRSTVSAILLEDQQYLKELAEMCSQKAMTWDERSKVRQDELAALTSAITIVKSTISERTSAQTLRLAQQGIVVQLADNAARSPREMEEIEAEAEVAEGSLGVPLAFWQLRSAENGFLAKVMSGNPSADRGREQVMALLRSRGEKLHSTLFASLMKSLGSDPLAKVKTLIQELIERLLKEAANDLNQNDWCNKAISDAEQKRTYAATAVEELNSQMATLEATRDKLALDVSILDKDIDELKNSQKNAETLRGQEKQQNAETVQEAQAGLEAVIQAIDILSKFYKTSDKATVVYSLVIAGQPSEDAPDAGFDNGEAYKGGQGTAVGIIAMMDIIKSDFQRTIAETEKAEALSEQNHLKFMTETGKLLAEKTTASDEFSKQKMDSEASLDQASDGLDSQMSTLATSIQELLELKPACIDTGMSYNDRVARRAEEIQALKKGLCILENYAQYGPEGEGPC